MIERMYYDETDTEGNAESVRGQPEIQQLMDVMKEMFRDVLQQVMADLKSVYTAVTENKALAL